jgi:muramoyltetrapeptide carboxypeptidase
MTQRLKPEALKSGDLIGIAAPASPFDPEEFKKGVSTLESLGYRVYYRPDIFEKKHYLAGRDERRAEELTELFTNPDIKAVFFARGGYGLLRVLPLLDVTRFGPKIVLGYSDITSLLIRLNQELNWVTFYGPVVAKDLGSLLVPRTLDSLKLAITSNSPLPAVVGDMEAVKPGVAEGILAGGCLSLLVASMGTPYEIDTRGSVLFMEDVNEKPYAVDRMLTQLKLGGKFKDVRGIIFGSFVGGGEIAHIREAAEDVLSDFNGPIVFNFPAGHGAVKMSLPLGVRVQLDADRLTLTYLEGALR